MESQHSAEGVAVDSGFDDDGMGPSTHHHHYHQVNIIQINQMHPPLVTYNDGLGQKHSGFPNEDESLAEQSQDVSRSIYANNSKKRFMPNKTQSNFMPSPHNFGAQSITQQNSPRHLTANASGSKTAIHGPQNQGANMIQQTSPFHSQRGFFPASTVKPQPTNKFYDTTFSKAFINHSQYEKHQKKIQKYQEEIQRLKDGRKSPSSEFDQVSLAIQQQFNKTRFNSKHFHQAEKSNEILKVNKNLAEKLFDIQMGKKHLRNKSIIHNNVVTPNLSPIGSLSIVYKKKQAQAIDTENMRLMRRILEANPAISNKKIEEGYDQHKKYKKIVKKAIKQGFDIDRMDQQQKKVFGHIESKTSSQLFPPIGGQHKRSRSTLGDISLIHGSGNIAQTEKRQQEFPFKSGHEESYQLHEIQERSKYPSPKPVRPTPLNESEKVDIEGEKPEAKHKRRYNRNKLRDALSLGPGEEYIVRKKSKKSRKQKTLLIGALPNFSMMNSEEELPNPSNQISPRFINKNENPSPNPSIRQANQFNTTQFTLNQQQQKILSQKLQKNTILKDKRSFLKSLQETQNTYNGQDSVQMGFKEPIKIKRNLKIRNNQASPHPSDMIKMGCKSCQLYLNINLIQVIYYLHVSFILLPSKSRKTTESPISKKSGPQTQRTSLSIINRKIWLLRAASEASAIGASQWAARKTMWKTKRSESTTSTMTALKRLGMFSWSKMNEDL